MTLTEPEFQFSLSILTPRYHAPSTKPASRHVRGKPDIGISGTPCTVRDKDHVHRVSARGS